MAAIEEGGSQDYTSAPRALRLAPCAAAVRRSSLASQPGPAIDQCCLQLSTDRARSTHTTPPHHAIPPRPFPVRLPCRAEVLTGATRGISFDVTAWIPAVDPRTGMAAVYYIYSERQSLAWWGWV